jgi:hypothetical protein
LKNLAVRIVSFVVVFIFLAMYMHQMRTYNQNILDVFNLIEANNQTDYVTQDTCVRIFHHAAHHDPYERIKKNDGSGYELLFCPECADMLRKAGLYTEPGRWIDEDLYEELMKIRNTTTGTTVPLIKK